jgi:signal transduction histidine kinase
MQYEKAEQDISSKETLRLEKLRNYEILNTAAESAFDQISQLAAEIFDVPYAGICFQDDGNFFVKSDVGGAASEIGQDLNGNRFSFFASMPIVSPDGYHVGLIYVADIKFKAPTAQQLKMLGQLANMVTEKLESRISTRRTFRAYDDRLHVLVHDLKNPMTTISLQSELLGRIPGIDERASLIAEKINTQSKRMIDNLEGLLSSARKEAQSFKPKKTKVDLKQVIEEVKFNLDLALKQKNQTVLIDIEAPVEIFGDADKLKVIFSQLLDNAIKFSPKGKEIKISHQTVENEVTIAVKDNGVGLTENDLDKIFLKFATLTAVATQHENNYGLGLITVNALVDIHQGKLRVESDGKDSGVTFFVTLPIK